MTNPLSEIEREELVTQWLDRYRNLLFKVVRSFAETAADQDDLFQEIYLQLWRTVHRFQATTKASTWIYRVALNTAISWERKQARTPAMQAGKYPASYQLIETDELLDERLEWLYEELRLLNRIDREQLFRQIRRKSQWADRKVLVLERGYIVILTLGTLLLAILGSGRLFV